MSDQYFDRDAAIALREAADALRAAADFLRAKADRLDPSGAAS